MNTQTQEAGYLFDFSKFLFDEHGLIVTDTEMQEIIHEAKKVATQPKGAGVECIECASWKEECERLAGVAKFWQEEYYKINPTFQPPKLDHL